MKDTVRSSEYARRSGIFYKSEIPYLVSVKDSPAASYAQAFVAYSPDMAPIQFMPLTRSFFADNTTEFTVSEGILTKSDSDIHGEITAAVSLPAGIISAYMKAVGGVFDSFKTNATSENELATINAQRQLCKAAIAANPIENEDVTRASANLAAIKAACGS